MAVIQGKMFKKNIKEIKAMHCKGFPLFTRISRSFIKCFCSLNSSLSLCHDIIMWNDIIVAFHFN